MRDLVSCRVVDGVDVSAAGADVAAAIFIPALPPSRVPGKTVALGDPHCCCVLAIQCLQGF
eukprot:4159418-Lingulodinium_polyedra.AAC.1